VDLTIDGGRRQHRSLDGTIAFVGLGRMCSRTVTRNFDWSTLGLIAAEAAGIEDGADAK
jgi:hypothetical protein